MRIGIISVTNQQKGLYRDTESLLFALAQVESKAEITVFAVDKMIRLCKPTETALCIKSRKSPFKKALSPGTELGEWIDSLDALVSCETLLVDIFDHAHCVGVRVVYVPNPRLGRSW